MSFSLNGLASGLDTGTIISQLMQLERIPYQKLEQKQSTLNSEQAIFRSINTKLSALRTAADELLLKNNFNLSSATNSDETVLKATVSEDVAETNFNVKVTQLARQHIIQSRVFEANGEDLVSNEDSSEKQIIVSGTPITLRGNTNEEVLTNLMNDINTAKVGVQASLVKTSTTEITLVLNSTKSGKENGFKFGEGTGSNVYIDDSFGEPKESNGTLEALGLKKLNGEMNEVQEARDALVNINGIDIVSSTNQLNNVITGLSLTLLKENSEANISVSKDADKIAEKVESFVNAFNDVLNTIKTNTSKGKGLQGDSTLRSLENYLTALFNRGVGDTDQFGNEDKPLMYLFEIGLEIDKGITDAKLMSGTIKFDKEKFKAALAEKPDEVFNLFAYDDRIEDDEETNSLGNSGIARLFKESLMDWTRSGTGILTSRIEGYDNDISFLRKQMDNMTARLDMKEAQLKRQFTAMESALIQLQNQQSWMASQIASMGIY